MAEFDHGPADLLSWDSATPRVRGLVRGLALVPVLLLVVLAGCGGDQNGSVKAQRNRQYSLLATADAASVTLVTEPAATTAPAAATTAPPVQPVAIMDARPTPAIDTLITQAMPYGGLAALQALLLAVASLGHSHARRVGLSLLSFGLVTVAALFALFSRSAVVDGIGFACVMLMGIAAMTQVFRPAGSVSRG